MDYGLKIEIRAIRMSFNGILTTGDKMQKILVLINKVFPDQSDRYFHNSRRIYMKPKYGGGITIGSLQYPNSWGTSYYQEEYTRLKRRL